MQWLSRGGKCQAPTRVRSCSAPEEFNIALNAVPSCCCHAPVTHVAFEPTRAKTSHRANTLSRTRRHARLLSSGCAFARSQLVLSCLIGWDRHPGQQRRKEGGMLGKWLQREALAGFRKVQQTPTIHYTVSFGRPGSVHSLSPTFVQTTHKCSWVTSSFWGFALDLK